MEISFFCPFTEKITDRELAQPLRENHQKIQTDGSARLSNNRAGAANRFL